MAYAPIDSYGIIGDLSTCALVGQDGSIDLMSFPRFDSPTVFAALLDEERGGRFRIDAELTNGTHKQLYVFETCVLLTRFLADEGVGELSDFMSVNEESHPHTLVRRAKTVRGRIKWRLLCAPRFDYGRAGHTVEVRDGEVVFASRGDDGTVLRLRTSVPVQVRDGDVVAEFELGEGDTASFTLEDARPHKESPTHDSDYVPKAFKRTINFWRDWIGRCNYRGRWREMVHRSALTLKLLTSQEHGSMVAAASFGLPEDLGGVRNWDYRYTWIRDASFALYALIRMGYTEEAGAFLRWIGQRCEDLDPDGALQIMYTIDGDKVPSEHSLRHWRGYRNSQPVRVGNGAQHQLQLDIYGELLDAVYLYNKYGQPISHDLWRNLVRLVDWVCDNWRRKDQGIWEIRSEANAHLYSRLLCWVAVDRGIRLANKRSFPYPMQRWHEVRDTIYHDIWSTFWDDDRQAFVGSDAGTGMDAATLLMPMLKFVSPVDPRWLSTLRAIEQDLVDDSLVFRYRIHGQGKSPIDGLAGGEGTFSMCSFWYVECLSRAGDVQKARHFFEKMLGYANHLGLYSEQLGPAGQHLGNYPQAFTHLALISAAHNLDRELDRHGHRG